ncbi:MAG: tripartite tricarboxylate transporter permease [Candidatus Diapherotrites archaeon]|nr:tripartite tricarboxylate transporter permease [Candidatus Diapherotrites archaeon]
MVFEIIIAAFLGVAFGVITGLVPGLHVNAVAPIAASLNVFSPIGLAVFIVCVAITHSFVDFIPSIFLGAPNEDTALSILPGHALYLQGRGFEAVKITVIGGLSALFVSILLVPVFYLALQNYSALETAMPFILLGVAFYPVLTEKGKNKINTALVIGLAGALGIITLKTNLNSAPLIFCALSGFFGVSTLLTAVQKQAVSKPQTLKYEKIPATSVAQLSFAGVVSGALTAALPGVGASQAAVISKTALSKISQKDFLFMLGAINTSNAIFCFAALWFMNRARSGAALQIKNILETNFSNLLIVGSAVLFACGTAALLTLAIARKASLSRTSKNDVRKIYIAVVGFLTVSSVAVGGLTGLIVLFTATGTGLFCQSTGIKRMYCMSYLLIPTALYFLGI